MIGPVRCFTCGKVLGDKYQAYDEMCAKAEARAAANKNKNEEEDAAANEIVQETYRGAVLNELGIKKMCCRRMMLSKVDLIGVI